MASAKRKRSYTCSQVVDMLANDSDSEGIEYEYDSDISDDRSESVLSEHTLSEPSTRPQTPIVPIDSGSSSSSADSDDDQNDDIEASVRVQGRQRVRAGRPRCANIPRVANGNNPQQNPINPHQQRVRQNQNNDTWELYDELDPYSCEWLPEFQERRGVLVDTTEFKPVNYFSLFFPDEVFELMTRETNRYAEQFLENRANVSRFSRFNAWEDTDISEVKAYVALQIAMGLCQKHEIADYWEKFWLTSTSFTDVMSKNRYLLLSSFIHFVDNEEVRPRRGEPGHDPLFKIKKLMDLCEPNYMEFYGPRRDLAIDESVIKFKGRVSFRQYMPSKPTRWGIKQFALCESKTGYALKFLTYLGKGTVEQVQGYSITESVCLKLMEGYLNKGHVLFTDNYYSSPIVFRKLELENTGACGTVKPGRQGMPRDLHPNELKLEKRSDPVFMRKENMVACAWHDTKRVHFLSTVSTNNTVDKEIRSRGAEGGRRIVEKPIIAETYNQNMGGVDILDQKLGTFAYPHKCAKWYHTIYHRCREVALVNAYILYQQDKGSEAVGPKAFRQEVIDGLIEGFQRRTVRRGRPSNTDQPLRLTERHFVCKFDDPKFRPDCAVCSDRHLTGWKRRQTNYRCKQCNVAMCVEPCHEIYHSYKDFKSAAARIVYKL